MGHRRVTSLLQARRLRGLHLLSEDSRHAAEAGVLPGQPRGRQRGQNPSFGEPAPPAQAHRSAARAEGGKRSNFIREGVCVGSSAGEPMPFVARDSCLVEIIFDKL